MGLGGPVATPMGAKQLEAARRYRAWLSVLPLPASCREWWHHGPLRARDELCHHEERRRRVPLRRVDLDARVAREINFPLEV